MIDKKMKTWIDNASYTQLLEKWRFASPGDPYFKGKVFDYYCEVMQEKKKQIGHTAAVNIGKSIGWEK